MLLLHGRLQWLQCKRLVLLLQLPEYIWQPCCCCCCCCCCCIKVPALVPVHVMLVQCQHLLLQCLYLLRTAADR